MTTIRTVRAIAVNVFRESVRDKVLYNLVAFAILLMGASYLIGQLTVGQDMKIMKDLGLAATLLFGLFIAVFIGIGLVSKEVERRSIYALLSKPIRRQEFIVGKYCGLLLTLLVNVGAMTLALYVVLGTMIFTQPPQAKLIWEAPALDPALLKAVLLIYAELAIITACALFFSSFSTPILSAAFTAGLFVIGQFNADLKHFENVVSSRPAAWMARVLYYTLPNLASFDVKAAVVHGQPVATGYILLMLGYAVVYIAMLLVITTMIFVRRDFK
jgi:ABC-type transport system involved in multi-copper enzyme maturation permease subunit